MFGCLDIVQGIGVGPHRVKQRVRQLREGSDLACTETDHALGRDMALCVPDWPVLRNLSPWAKPVSFPCAPGSHFHGSVN